VPLRVHDADRWDKYSIRKLGIQISRNQVTRELSSKLFQVVFLDVPLQILTKTLVRTIESLVSEVVPTTAQRGLTSEGTTPPWA
jgi:hypothetical protein